MALSRLPRAALPALVDALRSGRRLLGPTVEDGAIVLGPIERAEDLPIGWTDEQAPGRYRLVRRDDERAFGYVVGPSSPKREVFPAKEVLYRARRREDGKVGFEAVIPEPTPTAWLGLRACELAALRVTDTAFTERAHPDPRYAARRADTLIVGVTCSEPGALCFCASTGTGPRAGEGADIVLTERDDDLLVEARTEAGRAIVAALPTEAAEEADAAWIDDAVRAAEGAMGRHLDTDDLPGVLFGALDSPRWKAIADRCLACGNCTSVCPTCFCWDGVDGGSIDGGVGGEEATRSRQWDSCFTHDHGAVHQHSVRPTTADRYRQWLTHKLGAWVPQLGSSGCVGCGRCIAWCPVGIDLTVEAAALRAEGHPSAPLPPPRRLVAGPMTDPLTPRPATVTRVVQETRDVVTLHVHADGLHAALPGQFCQLSLPGIGEAPISLSGITSDGLLEHTVRAVGPLTQQLCALPRGAEIGIRGPYGTPWPLDALAGRPVVVIAGGIGLAPLRGALRAMAADRVRFPDVRLFLGARSPSDLLFEPELRALDGLVTRVTVDHAPVGWTGDVGVVTRLLTPRALPDPAARPAALLCGPEVMMRFAIRELAARGFDDASIWVTLERHMKCATGTCGRCQLGPFFVCEDGPVFRLDEVRGVLFRDGF